MKLNLPKQRSFKGPAIIWKRIIAFVLDLLILDFIIGIPFRNLIIRIVPNNGFTAQLNYFNSNPGLLASLSVIMVAYGLMMLLYFSILEYKIGQTVGKIFMNIKVDSDKKNFGFFSFIIRSMYMIMIFPFILLWIVDPIFIFFNKDGRRLSEILSKTRTIAMYSI